MAERKRRPHADQKSDFLTSLLPVIRLLRPYWRRMLLSLALSVLTIASSVGLMMTSAWLISTAALQMGIVSLGVAPTAVRFFGLSRAIFRYLERLVSHDVTFRLLARLRVWFYARIEPLSLIQLQSLRGGDLLSRVVSDIDELQNIYLRVVSPPIVAVLVTAGMGVTFVFFDVRSALVLVAFMVATGITLPIFARWAGDHAGREMIAERRAINTRLVESIQGLADAVASGHAKRLQAQLDEMSERLKAREREMGRLDGVQNGLSLLLANLAAVAVLWVAAGRVDGVLLASLTLGSIAAFEAITPLGLAGQNLGKEMAAAQRVFEIIETAPVIQDPAAEPQSGISQPQMDTDEHRLNGPICAHLRPSAANKNVPDVSLEGVTFGYSKQIVYSDFSLDIAYGSRLLITGESGSGKSSLVNLLLRFAEYEAGRISVGGVDLRTLPHEEVRRTFGVLTQRTYLFNTTIRENIRIGRKSAADAEVEDAARAAQIHDFIAGLPDGYGTYVGEDGVLLSGGERQRIALARLLLEDASIWLLDEITANLDAVTAVKVLDAVMEAASNRTVVLMTHRVDLVRGYAFDQVVRLSIS